MKVVGELLAALLYCIALATSWDSRLRESCQMGVEDLPNDFFCIIRTDRL